jgi:hypothetical protein
MEHYKKKYEQERLPPDGTALVDEERRRAILDLLSRQGGFWSPNSPATSNSSWLRLARISNSCTLT